MKQRPAGLIVCGTDTDVGKTVISALLVQGLNATYWKPIQSGLEEDGDRGRVLKWLNLPTNRTIKERYKFKAAVSPHWAAEKEDILINTQDLSIPEINNFLIVETAGGLLVPLTREVLQIDQIKKWNLPIVLVTRTELGTINHTLLSIEALKKRAVPILGLIFNGVKHQDNPKTIAKFANVPILAQIPHLSKINPTELSNIWEKNNLNITFTEAIQALS